MKKIIILIIVLLVLGVAGFFFYEEQREARYQDCMYQCEQNNQCLEYRQEKFGGCLKNSEPECKNICIQKYK